MHPVMIRIPIPVWTLPLFWVGIVLAGLAAAAALGMLLNRNRSGAGIAAAAAAAAVAFAFAKQGQTFETGPLPIYSYGVMLGLSLVVGWYLTLGLAERDGLPKETMANCYVATAIAAVAGSRILYVLTNLHEFDSIGSIFAMRSGGLVAYGGFLGGFLGSLAFLRYHKLPLLPWADVAVPSLASGLMITRIGCYLFGCDFGRPLSDTAPAWLKKLGSFPHWPEGTLDNAASGSPAWAQHVKQRGLPITAEHSLPVHPTQLYEMTVGAGLLILLLMARRRQQFRGEIFLLFTFAYGVCRYLLEILRDDMERGSVPPSLPEHVLIPLGLVIFAVSYAIGFSKKVENVTLRRLTQVLAFIPAVALYLAMKPQTFAAETLYQYSTSQAVALTTAFAASIAFAVYYKAALAHPEAAMALNLPAEAPAGGAADEDDDDDDEDDDDARAEEAAAKKKVAPKKTTAKKAAPKRRADEDDNDDDDSDDGDEPDAAKGDEDEAPRRKKAAAAEED